MIKCKKGTVDVCGTTTDLLTELSTIVHSLYYDLLIGKHEFSHEVARGFIHKAVNLGLMTKEELEAEEDSKKKKLVEVIDALKEILLREDEE